MYKRQPLINPMAQAAAVVQYDKLDEKTEDQIKGMCSGSENYCNFFAQNCFMGSSGTLLIVSTLSEPVSYTHLDVYKRQAKDSAMAAERTAARHFPAIFLYFSIMSSWVLRLHTIHSCLLYTSYEWIILHTHGFINGI